MEETIDKNNTNRSKEASIISGKSDKTENYFSEKISSKDVNKNNKNEIKLPNILNNNLRNHKTIEKSIFKCTNNFKSKYIVSKRHSHGCFHCDNSIKIEKLTKKNYFGPSTLGLEEKTFNLIVTQETLPTYNKESKYIKVIDNNHNLNNIKKENPFQSTVNRALVTKDEKLCFSFKAKNYYEKAYNLSLQPKDIKYDSNNPIFLHLANPHEYRFFSVD